MKKSSNDQILTSKDACYIVSKNISRNKFIGNVDIVS